MIFWYILCGFSIGTWVTKGWINLNRLGKCDPLWILPSRLLRLQQALGCCTLLSSHIFWQSLGIPEPRWEPQVGLLPLASGKHGKSCVDFSHQAVTVKKCPACHGVILLTFDHLNHTSISRWESLLFDVLPTTTCWYLSHILLAMCIYIYISKIVLNKGIPWYTYTMHTHTYIYTYVCIYIYATSIYMHVQYINGQSSACPASATSNQPVVLAAQIPPFEDLQVGFCSPFSLVSHLGLSWVVRVIIPGIPGAKWGWQIIGNQTNLKPPALWPHSLVHIVHWLLEHYGTLLFCVILWISCGLMGRRVS